MKSVYLDYNATTPIAKEVAAAITAALTDAWGNPSSPYEAGVKAKKLIEISRKGIARMIKVPESTIVFTSGGTESNNLVIHSAVQFYLKSSAQNSNGSAELKPHIITSNIEHDSILKPLEHMAGQGLISLSTVKVRSSSGCIDIEYVIQEIREETCLITVMMANNETGLIQPIAELGERLALLNQRRKIPVLFHTDAAQAIGKIKVSIEDLQVHYLTIVGHKFYGPRIGAIYAAADLKSGPPLLTPFLFGGGQEKGLRPGTENTAMIVGLGEAARLVVEHIDEYEKHMLYMRDYLEKKLSESFGDKIAFNNVGRNVPRLPNTTSVSFSFDTATGSRILSCCSSVFASTGAACHGTNKPSIILINSGVSKYCAERTLRLSVGRETTESDIDFCISKLKSTISEFTSK